MEYRNLRGIDLEAVARKLRLQTLTALYAAQSGHPGSSMSSMDLLVALYFGGVVRYRSEQPDWDERDIFILSNGHAAPALYAVLALAGFFSDSELDNLRKLGSGAQGHPHKGSLPGIETSTGSLGQGLSCAIGIAYADRLQGIKRRIFVMMSDGEQQEGSTWEAVMAAAKLGLRITAIVDKNGMQIDGRTEVVMPSLDPLKKKYESFGWIVEEIDGHNFAEIIPALNSDCDAPNVVIAHTTRGKGVSFMENSEHWHAGKISDDQFSKIKEELK